MHYRKVVTLCFGLTFVFAACGSSAEPLGAEAVDDSIELAETTIELPETTIDPPETTDAATWILFDDPDYSIEFPGTPVRDETTTQGISVEMQTVELDHGAYSVSTLDAPVYDLGAGLDGVFTAGFGTGATNVEDLTVDGHNCKKGSGAGEVLRRKVKLKAIVCYDGMTAYLLQVVSDIDAYFDPDPFFGTFTIKT